MWILLVILAFRFCHGERFFADHISLPNSGNDAILLHVFHLQRAPRDEVSDEEFANIEKFEENAPLLGTSDGSGSSGAGSGEGGSSKKTSSMTSSSSSGRDKRVDASSIVLDLDAFTEKNEASKQAKNVKAEEKPPVVGGSSLLSKSSREPNDAVSLTSSSSSSTSSSSSSAPPATTPPASSSSSTTNAPPAAAAAPPATSSSATSPPTAVVDDNVAPSTQLFPPSSIPTALGEETKTKPDYSPPPSSNSTARNKKVARMKKKTNSTGTAGALVSSPAAATDSTTSSTVISENRTAAPTMAAAEDKKEKKDVVPKQESPSSKMNSTSSKTGSSSATGAATTPATSSVSSATTIASSSATNRTSSLVETEPSKGKGFKKKKNKKVPGLRVNATTVSVSPKTNNTKKSDSSVANEPIKSDPTAPVPKVADEAPKTDASRTPAKTETAAPSTKAGGVSSSPEISEVTAAPTKADAAAPAAADAALPPPPAKSEAAAPPPAKTESASAVAPNLPKSEPEKPPTTSNVEPVVSAPGTKSEPVKAPPAKSEPAAAPLPPETVSPQTTLVEQPSGEKGAPPPPPAPTTKSTTKTKSSSAVQNLNEDSGFGRRFLSRILEAAGGSSSPKASARMTSTTSTTSKGKIHGDEFLIDVPTRLIRRNTGAPAAAALGTSSGSTSSTYPADLRLVLLSYTQYLLSCGGNKMTECLCPTTTRSTIFPLLDGPPGGTTIGTSASSIRRKIPIPAQEGYFLLLLVNCNGGKIRRLGAAEENEKTFARPLRDLWPQAQVATDAVGAAPAGSSSLVVVSVRNEPPLQQLSPFSSSSTSRALAELPSSTTVELHGEITVQYHHGFLNASNLKKYQFYHTLLWCYLLLAAIWGCITLTAKAYFRSRGEVKMLLVHRYLTRVLLLCVIEVFLWYLKFRVWNGSGYRQWALLFLARMAYAVKVSMFWVMLSLIVAKCCGVYRLILSSNVKPVDDMGGKKQRTVSSR
ncbi:unnamed protein product [Amoebophrya sp. A25]|nr:unnamed protein product [Amoebophrya sp. A25]|eukprot:GSA25T00003413001.1